MTPFALAIRDEGFDLLKLQKHELIEKMPNIQIHTIVDLKLLVSIFFFDFLIFIISLDLFVKFFNVKYF